MNDLWPCPVPSNAVLTFSHFNSSVIIIIGVSVRFTEEDYRINESEGTVVICVRRLGDAASSLTVIVRSRETSPVGARGR